MTRQRARSTSRSTAGRSAAGSLPSYDPADIRETINLARRLAEVDRIELRLLHLLNVLVAHAHKQRELAKLGAEREGWDRQISNAVVLLAPENRREGAPLTRIRALAGATERLLDRLVAPGPGGWSAW